VNSLEGIEVKKDEYHAQIVSLVGSVPSNFQDNRPERRTTNRGEYKTPPHSVYNSELRGIPISKSNTELGFFHSRTRYLSPNSSSARAQQDIAEQSLSKKLQSIVDKGKKVAASFKKYISLNPAKSPESQLQSQVIELELKNLQSLITSSLRSSAYSPSPKGQETKAGKHILGVSVSNQSLDPNRQHAALLKEKLKLERKCEDRKASIKKLYFLVMEKDKQLQRAYDSVHLLKEALIEVQEAAEKDMKDKMKQIEGYERRIGSANCNLNRLREMLFSFRDRPFNVHLVDLNDHNGLLSTLNLEKNPYLTASTFSDKNQPTSKFFEHKSKSHSRGKTPDAPLLDSTYMTKEGQITVKDIVNSRFELASLLGDLRASLNLETRSPKEILEQSIVNLDIWKSRNTEIKRSYNQASETLKGVNHSANEKLSQYEKTIEEIRQLEEERAKEVKKLKTHIHEQNTKLFSKEKQHLEEELSLKAKIEDLEADNNRLRQLAMAGKSESLAEKLANEANAKLKQKVEEKERVLVSQERLIAQLGNQLEGERVSAAEQLESVKKAHQGETQSLQSQLSKANSLAGQLQDRLVKYQKEKESEIELMESRLNSEIRTIQKDLLAHIASEKELEKEIRDLKNREVTLQRQLDQNMKELEAKKADIEDLNSRLTKPDAIRPSLEPNTPIETEAFGLHDQQFYMIMEKVAQGLEDIMDKKHYLHQELVTVRGYIEGTIEETVESITLFVKVHVSQLIRDYQSRLSQAKAELMQAKTKVKELEESQQGSSQSGKGSHGELGDSSSIRVLGNELENSKKQVEALKSQLLQHEKSREKLTGELQEKERVVSQLKLQFSQDLLKKDQLIQDSYQKISAHIEENHKNSQIYNEQMKSLEHNSRLIADDLKKLICENEQLTSDLAAKHSQLSEKESELGRLAEIISEISGSKGQITSLSNITISKLAPGIKELKSYDELIAENVDLRGTSKDLVAQIGSLQERFSSLKDNYLKLEAEKQELKDQLLATANGNKELQLDLVQRRALDEERVRYVKELARKEKLYMADLESLNKVVLGKEAEIVGLASSLKDHTNKSQSIEANLQKTIEVLGKKVSVLESRVSEVAKTAVAHSGTDPKDSFTALEGEINQLTINLKDAVALKARLTLEIAEKENYYLEKLEQKDKDLQDLAAKVMAFSSSKSPKENQQHHDLNEGDEEQEFVPGARVETSQGDEHGGNFYENDDTQNAFCWLIFGNLVLRYQNAALSRKDMLARLKWVKVKSKLLKYKSMQSEKQKINDELKAASQRELAAKQKKAELEDQLKIRENQIDDLINSRPSRHDQREDMKTSKSKIDKSKDDPKALQLTQKFSSTLGMLQNFFTFDIPPMDDLYHRDWDTFVRKLKDQIRIERLEKDNLKETVSQYKLQLNSKALEVEELHQKLKGRPL
jgi:DNA repair exonuclease SbcCD ATPase subunit